MLQETFGICYIDVASTLLTTLSARSRNETLVVYTARRGARPVIQGRNRFKSALPVTEQQ
ncbi:hypothetical protein SPRG_13425 [Saprolegnia parasitica CBS 223.65]|uniref:Uncharacterized protein n=1 Tax=Saprolegnia parasitica (strain CBS 223.65) TaxID=695850 RepID=A0A067BR18_SAPPC|nr:hypothetical protein SPRG_13425 [Saprolegnia parasitica CBS 223.65]KDO20673.1 hypothetical protein SPRG_13425 [Saprolegnia parasitica CBS 223.65]|eukprot:XP_012208638.1 hypothetical protein SPRG_13425 [Saprolegnia parasitica CBS 223.65]